VLNFVFLFALDIFYPEWIVGNAGVVHIGFFVFLYILYQKVCEGQGNNFIACFHGCLCQYQHQQGLHGNDTRKGNAEKDHGIGSFAHNGRSYGTYGEAPSVLHNFHFTHHVGVEERTKQKRDKAGCHYALGVAQHGFERNLVGEMNRTRRPNAEAENNDGQKIHEETIPDNEARFAIAPHFGYQVVDNVRNWENE